jgi:hypothetical protein
LKFLKVGRASLKIFAGVTLVTTLLLYRHALRQVARLIDVAPAHDGDVIGQQL